jgi:DNA-binding transcriptional LysR family regulator
MDFLALKAFLAVAKEGSFSRAAEQLFITQPAVSKRIAGLEQQLNALLFDRVGRTITLTEHGRALLPHARSIIDQVTATENLLGTLSDEVGGTLSIASSHHIGLHRLPKILKSYTRQFPAVELDLEFLDSETACHKVEHGELELALITLPETITEALQTTQIWHDPLVIVVSNEDLLAREAGVSREQLLQRRAILPQMNTFTRSIVTRQFQQTGHEIRTIMETNNLETIRKMVEIGLGWSALPETMLSPALTSLTVAGVRLSRSLGLIRHRNRSLSNAAQAMSKLLKQEKAT